MRRDLVVTALCLLVLGFTVQALAEVRAVTNRDGSYKMTRVLHSGREGSVWTPVGRGRTQTSLNTLGDRNGDLYPTIRESSVAPHHPWVVWSRLNANVGRYDLAWSRWSVEGWTPIDWVAPGGNGDGDSLDADLAFDGVGRPYVAWWRHEGGAGRVFLSMFLESTWMTPFDVSEAGIDSRYPTIEVLEEGSLVIRYETEEGLVDQTIVFDFPVTITDDINPLDYIHTGSKSVVPEQ